MMTDRIEDDDDDDNELAVLAHLKDTVQFITDEMTVDAHAPIAEHLAVTAALYRNALMAQGFGERFAEAVTLHWVQSIWMKPSLQLELFVRTGIPLVHMSATADDDD